MAGWEPATVTHYEYDDDGRLVRSVTVSEAEWSPEDVALLVASRQAERELGSHGIPLSEAFDPANQFRFKGQDAPRVDYAEKARLDAQEAFYKQHDKKDMPVNRHGHVWGVTKR